MVNTSQRGPAQADELAPPPMGTPAKVAYRIIRLALQVAAAGWVRLDVTGKEHVPIQGGFILCPGGHRSILDTPLVSLVGPRVLRYVGAETYFATPGLGTFLRSMGGFPVERSMTDRTALRLSESVLRNGEPLVVFPEGTRQTGPIIQPLKEGAAFLSCRVGVPILPVGIGGTERAMAKGARFVKPRKVSMVIGQPIFPPPRSESARVKRSVVTNVSHRLHGELQMLFDEAQVRAGV